ncbi:uncharacterized protein LY89DRAFT_689694 [Mollisia scopiformis]|uniref:Uncharacterized protein n=1 Tax=Mollisia scopiformis TaxID=149040 RepID=A0A132BF10_MOLSC|nr:uncharacterized protein LY89DRAFT_689694 [Mollisia scopiformis]KUJ10454.1 hypothetical protein LY89DRAFT_689694 [Mollisia scopiformis]
MSTEPRLYSFHNHINSHTTATPQILPLCQPHLYDSQRDLNIPLSRLSSNAPRRNLPSAKPQPPGPPPPTYPELQTLPPTSTPVAIRISHMPIIRPLQLRKTEF